MPGAIDRAKRGFEGFSQSLVTKLLPPLINLVEKIAPTVSHVFHVIGDALTVFFGALTGNSEVNEFDGALKKVNNTGIVVGEVFAKIVQVFKDDVLPTFKSVASVVGDVLAKALPIIGRIITETLLPAFAAIARVIREDLLPIWRQIADFVIGTLAPALAKILGAAINAARGAFEKIGKALHDHQKEINQVISVLKTLAGFIIAVAIPVLKVAFKIAFEVLGTSIAIAIGVISGFVDAITGIVHAAESVINWLKGHWPQLLAILTAPISLAVLVITKSWDAIKRTTTTAFNAVKNTITSVLHAITGIWSRGWNAMRALVAGVWRAIRAVVQREINGVKAIISAVMGAIKAVWSAGWNAMKAVVSAIWAAITGIVQREIDGVKALVDRFVGFFTALPGRMSGIFHGMFDGIKDAFRSAVNFIIHGWNSLQFKIPGFDPPGPGPKFGGFTLGVPDIPELAIGGTAIMPGWALTGEHGPELTYMPAGASVIPLPDDKSSGLLAEQNALLREQNALLARQPAAFAGALNGVARSAAYGAR
jgi:phage-related protein